MTYLEDSSQINDPKRVINAPRMCAAMLTPPWIPVAIHRPGWYSLINHITLVGRLLQSKIVVWTRRWRRRNKSFKGDIWRRLLVGKAHLFVHVFFYLGWWWGLLCLQIGWPLVSELVSEWASLRVNQQVNQWASEPEWMSEWPTDRLTDWPIDWPTQ